MPIKTSGLMSLKVLIKLRRIFNNSGKRPKTSTNPITERRSIG